MAERTYPWRPKPPQNVVDLLQRVATTRLYLVQRMGPASFIVREEGSDMKRRVLMGGEPSCSCWTPGHGIEPCIHTLFVLAKVLRVPQDNPLMWQLSLTDRELEEVLACSAAPLQTPAEGRQRLLPKAQDPDETGVKRKALDEEDVCPICYEDITSACLPWLVWCRYGCGNNIHGKCMGVWADHQTRSLGKALTCPFCRTDWGEFKWKPPPRPRKVKQVRTDVHYGCRCGACRNAPLTGSRYRCLVCNDFNLCATCFASGSHPQHPFACREAPGGQEAVATRPGMMPAAVQLRPQTDHTHHSRSSSGGTDAGGLESDNDAAEQDTADTATREADQAGTHRGAGVMHAGQQRTSGRGNPAPQPSSSRHAGRGERTGSGTRQVASHPVNIQWHDGPHMARLDDLSADSDADSTMSDPGPAWMQHASDSAGTTFSNFTNAMADSSGTYAEPDANPSMLVCRVATRPLSQLGSAPSDTTSTQSHTSLQRSDAAAPYPAQESAAPAPSSRHFTDAFTTPTPTGSQQTPSFASDRPSRRRSEEHPAQASGSGWDEQGSSAAAARRAASMAQPMPSSSHFGAALTDATGRRHSSLPRSGNHTELQQPRSGLRRGLANEHTQQPSDNELCLAGRAAGEPSTSGRPAAVTAPVSCAGTRQPSAGSGTAARGVPHSRSSSAPRQCPRRRTSTDAITGRQAAGVQPPLQLQVSVLNCQSGSAVGQEVAHQAATVSEARRVLRTLSCPPLQPAAAAATTCLAPGSAPVALAARSRRTGRNSSGSSDGSCGVVPSNPAAAPSTTPSAAASPALNMQTQEQNQDFHVDAAVLARAAGQLQDSMPNMECSPEPAAAARTDVTAGASTTSQPAGAAITTLTAMTSMATPEPSGAATTAATAVTSVAPSSQVRCAHVNPASASTGPAVVPRIARQSSGWEGLAGTASVRLARSSSGWDGGAEAPCPARCDSLGLESQSSSFSLPEHVDPAALRTDLASCLDAPSGGSWLARPRCKVAPEAGTSAGTSAAHVLGTESQSSSFSLPEHVDPGSLQSAAQPLQLHSAADPAAVINWLSRQRQRVAPESAGDGAAAALPAGREATRQVIASLLADIAGTSSQSSSFSLPDQVDGSALSTISLVGAGHSSDSGPDGPPAGQGLPNLLSRSRARVLPAALGVQAAGERAQVRLPSLRSRRVEPQRSDLLAQDVSSPRSLLPGSFSPASQLQMDSKLTAAWPAWSALHSPARAGLPAQCAPAAAAAMALKGEDKPDWKTFSNPAFNRPYGADLPAP